AALARSRSVRRAADPADPRPVRHGQLADRAKRAVVVARVRSGSSKGWVIEGPFEAPLLQSGTIAARVTWPLSCSANARLISSSGYLLETTRLHGYFVSVRSIRSSAP